MNTDLEKLQAYPFERLRALLAGITPPINCVPISLGIGEPKHATPALIREAMAQAGDELAFYPSTQGSEALRDSIAQWLKRRYALKNIDPFTQVLPVNGSREALFSIAQTVVTHGRDASVVCPNPFYQIYEGAAFLAGATPYFINADKTKNFAHEWSSVPASIWQKTQLVFVCSPDNPSGVVMQQGEWELLFTLADQYGFVIVSDECYSEIYFDEAHPPLGALTAAQNLGRTDYRQLLVCSSLSKRSNVPGLRSGFVAGDASVIAAFTRYRTYHGCAMGGVVQKASIEAWQDEAHVKENRRLYAEKFARVVPLLQTVLPVTAPEAGFYLWADVSRYQTDTAFAQGLYQATGVTVLPGSYLARSAHGSNPGAGFVRMALVAPLSDCLSASERIVSYIQSLSAAQI